MKNLELLSPAKSLEYGKAAINCGADAVYIGASKFGARVSVGNSISDIEQLAKYAHAFNGRVYAALNTLLFDKEIEEANKLIHQLWNAGVDALIIQDFGLLETNLPPIPIFASTQTNNTNWQKVLFLEKIGIKRVILARELSIAEISEIRNYTTIELESFIHGAICVGYSGQCYLSHALTGRSGNRGECAQPCRWDFSLKDYENKIHTKGQHLLSMKDLNLTDHIEDLVNAGITSFKIEGRLKDLSYVKNITGWYRKILDDLIEKKSNQIRQQSSGKTIFDFEPDVDRTFNRGYTNYFINGRNKDMASFSTQKSIGKLVGEIRNLSPNWITAKLNEPLSNGDGLCFFDENNVLQGFRVNKVEGEMIYPLEMPKVKAGIKLYRNHDQKFETQVSASSTKRKIAVSIQLIETENGFQLSACDEDSIKADLLIVSEKIQARDKDKNETNIKQSLAKTGNTIFEAKEINIEGSFFIPNSILNELRRETLNLLEDNRIHGYKRVESVFIPNNYSYPESVLDYKANVVNVFAEKFYKRHNANVVEKGLELTGSRESEVLMTTRYCLKFEMGQCPKKNKVASGSIKQKMLLENDKVKLEIEFDCKNCVMNIR